MRREKPPRTPTRRRRERKDPPFPTRVRRLPLKSAAILPFDAQAFLETAGVARRVVRFPSGTVIYAQGDPAVAVIYIQEGEVKLSVLSSGGKEAVVGMMGEGEFFGEGCLAGQKVRMGTATAIAPTAVLEIGNEEMLDVLHEQSALSDLFISHILAKNIRIEEDLIDQLFNSSEKRLARTLLLLGRYGKSGTPHRILPKISQEVLAAMVGTTRSRINAFMNKFRRLGFIEYNGDIQIHPALLSVVLHD